MCNSMVEPDRPQIVGRIRFAWRVSKATDTHSEYEIFIYFPLQQWLLNSASLLRYTYIAFLVSRFLGRFLEISLTVREICQNLLSLLDTFIRPLVSDQRDAQIPFDIFICFYLKLSTYFEHIVLIIRREKLYQYILWLADTICLP